MPLWEIRKPTPDERLSIIANWIRMHGKEGPIAQKTFRKKLFHQIHNGEVRKERQDEKRRKSDNPVLPREDARLREIYRGTEMRGCKKRECDASAGFQGALQSLPKEENQEKAQELQTEGKGKILSFRKGVLLVLRRAVSRGIGNWPLRALLHQLQMSRSLETYVQGKSDKEGYPGDDCPFR